MQAEKPCAKELKEWGMYCLPPLYHPHAFPFCWGAAVASTMLTPVRPSGKQQHSEEFRCSMGKKKKKPKPLLPVFIFIHACALHPDTV